jgi:hypothetical protein
MERKNSLLEPRAEFLNEITARKMLEIRRSPPCFTLIETSE